VPTISLPGPLGSLADSAVSLVRREIGNAVGSRVRGPNGDAIVADLEAAQGEPSWFSDDSPLRTVHIDSAMFIGGLRALLLQSLHPRAMAGVAQHSAYRTDPWGRLQRTAEFLVRTSFGSAAQAEQACAMVRRVHERVVGTTADGEPYAANDPWLMAWVHACEVESFLVSNQRYGRTKLTPAQCDQYVADMAMVAATLGADPVPTDVGALRALLHRFRSELRRTPEALDGARFLLIEPPLPWAIRPVYGVLAGAAYGSLPIWAQQMLGIPIAPPVEATMVRPVAGALVGVLRWATVDAQGGQVA
jgi:uncharacterized protein (DUF2236 family)